MMWNLGIAGFAFANMCSAGPFMERRVSIFGCFVGATKEAQHEDHHTRNFSRIFDRFARGFRAKLSRHDLATRREFPKGRYNGGTEKLQEAHG
jgi:hypothetical protein